MKLLLDTHAALWFVDTDPRLPETARAAIRHADTLLLSSVVAWEVAIKRGQGRLRAPPEYLAILQDAGAEPLPITLAHAQGVAALPDHHGDPFDRMLVAQAQLEDATIVTREPAIAQYGVPVLW